MHEIYLISSLNLVSYGHKDDNDLDAYQGLVSLHAFIMLSFWVYYGTSTSSRTKDTGQNKAVLMELIVQIIKQINA